MVMGCNLLSMTLYVACDDASDMLKKFREDREICFGEIQPERKRTMKYVITLNRQFGSLGRPIAQRVSELLKIEKLDKKS